MPAGYQKPCAGYRKSLMMGPGGSILQTLPQLENHKDSFAITVNGMQQSITPDGYSLRLDRSVTLQAPGYLWGGKGGRRTFGACSL